MVAVCRIHTTRDCVLVMLLWRTVLPSGGCGAGFVFLFVSFLTCTLFCEILTLFIILLISFLVLLASNIYLNKQLTESIHQCCPASNDGWFTQRFASLFDVLNLQSKVPFTHSIETNTSQMDTKVHFGVVYYVYFLFQTQDRNETRNSQNKETTKGFICTLYCTPSLFPPPRALPQERCVS